MSDDTMNNSALLEGIQPVAFLGTNVIEDQSRFKRRIRWIIDGMSAIALVEQNIGILLSRICDEGGNIFKTFELDEDATYEDVITKFNNYLHQTKEELNS